MKKARHNMGGIDESKYKKTFGAAVHEEQKVDQRRSILQTQ